jgi:hypothetical protein
MYPNFSKNISIISFIIIIISIIVFFVIYRYITYNKENFEGNITGLSPNIVNNPEDDSFLNNIGETITFSGDKLINDLFKRVKKSLELDNVEIDTHSSERWWATKRNNSPDEPCPQPPVKVEINPIVSSPIPATCTGPKLTYVKGIKNIKFLNNLETIIVNYDKTFPESPKAVGYTITGENVQEGTKIVDYIIGLASGGRTVAIYITLNKPILRYSKKQVFCYSNIQKAKYRGCWGDTSERALPYRGTNVKNKEDCMNQALKNKLKYFGLQYYGECWMGSNENWDRYGKRDDIKCGPLGTDWANQIYEIPDDSYKGCWIDTNERALPYRGSNVKTKEECLIQAKENNFKYIGLQYYGECWMGNNEDWNKYGKRENDICGPLGTDWSNQIYEVK